MRRDVTALRCVLPAAVVNTALSFHMNGAFEELSWRGLVQQTTAENFAEVLATPLTMYVGADPSAPSLHAGNLVPLMMMTHLRRAGHQVIALVGGATGMIGDPSGKIERAQAAEQRRA